MTKPTQILVLAAAAALAAGCVPGTIDEPVPFQLGDGERGFQFFGEVNYTGSVEKARAVVQGKLDAACGGKARFIRFSATPDSSGPIDVVDFDSVATCR